MVFLKPHHFRAACILICAALLFSCGTTGEIPDVEYLYQKDLKLEVNGEKFIGVGVPKEAIKYNIEMKSRGKSDYFQFTTCGRFRKQEDEGRSVEWTYVPMDEIENRGDCPMDIVSLDKKARHGWGKLIFPYTKKYNLPAYLRCNGFEGQTHGTSVCDALVGLEANIKFSVEVLTALKGECVMPPSADRKLFKFNIKRGDCAYKFKQIGEDKWHVLYISGFDRSLYRGD